jgi:hypothetical protein
MKAVGSRAEVMHGKAAQTAGGLTKKKLKVSKASGEIVSVKAAKKGKKNPWAVATEKARDEMGIKEGEMVLMNDGAKGKALYALTKQIHGRM